jgi:hypothetical protein
MEIGGALGLTAAFEREDPALRRALIEKQLDVYREHGRRYQGMVSACTEQLSWNIDRYARLPAAPELLATDAVPSAWNSLTGGISLGCCISPVIFVAIMVIFSTGPLRFRLPGWPIWIASISWGIGISVRMLLRYRVIRGNGNKPSENQRRLLAHESAVKAAFTEASSIKNAEDHRLRQRIVEAEGKIGAITRKEAELVALLGTL